MRAFRTLALAAIAILAISAPANAITFGQLDGNGHPNVGAMVLLDENGDPGLVCSGTLISPTVFLTASHCTAFLPEIGVDAHDVYVTFDPVVGPGATLYRGTAHTNPLYGGPESDPHDVAVIVLDEAPAGITPAHLPTANLLDQLDLKSQRFVTVGYGVARDDKTKGPASLFFDATRRSVDQGFRSMTKAWLNLSMNPSVGSGGTCYGDSGGPHFVGSSDVVVAVTVTGDVNCRATDVDYRVDTDESRAFLSEFVTLP
ncbi:MAG TPA: trypsin-like serine protease [Verrucomicrobiae bacterium]|nr:trypsin-like serine protease [Verrucomicrobiae bacterium]